MESLQPEPEQQQEPEQETVENQQETSDEFQKYPSIEHFRHLLVKLYKEPLLIGPRFLQFEGTVKLHGTHADIVYDGNETFVVQSRNRILTKEADNQQCYAFFHQPEREKALITLLQTHFPNQQVMLSGEFCGKGIQTGMGINHFDRFFMIFDICLEGKWEKMSSYSHIQCDEQRLYNITHFPMYLFQLNLDLLNDQEYITSIASQLQKEAEQIGLECPVAKQLGREQGEGEGIVYKCIDYPTDYHLWFKSKCEKHSVGSVRAPKVKKNYEEEADDTVHEYVTEARCLQGIEYLKEMNISVQDKAFIGKFIQWMIHDICKEETQFRTVGNKHKIISLAKEWILKQPMFSSPILSKTIE